MEQVPPEADATLNPEGKVTLIFPVEAMALTVVKVMVAVPVAPATKDAGATLVDVMSPTPAMAGVLPAVNVLGGD